MVETEFKPKSACLHNLVSFHHSTKPVGASRHSSEPRVLPIAPDSPDKGYPLGQGPEYDLNCLKLPQELRATPPLGISASRAVSHSQQNNLERTREWAGSRDQQGSKTGGTPVSEPNSLKELQGNLLSALHPRVKPQEGGPHYPTCRTGR